jgi:hypothetical protein
LTTGLFLLLLALSNSYFSSAKVLRHYCLIGCGERLPNPCIFGAWIAVRVTRLSDLLHVTADLQMTACQHHMRCFALVRFDGMRAPLRRMGHDGLIR